MARCMSHYSNIMIYVHKRVQANALRFSSNQRNEQGPKLNRVQKVNTKGKMPASPHGPALDPALAPLATGTAS